MLGFQSLPIRSKVLERWNTPLLQVCIGSLQGFRSRMEDHHSFVPKMLAPHQEREILQVQREAIQHVPEGTTTPLLHPGHFNRGYEIYANSMRLPDILPYPYDPLFANTSFIGLFDGHAGDQCADHLASYLPRYIASSPRLSPKNVQVACRALDVDIMRSNDPGLSQSGSCAAFGMFTPRYETASPDSPWPIFDVTVGNVGDSRVLYGRMKPRRQLPHSPWRQLAEAEAKGRVLGEKDLETLFSSGQPSLHCSEWTECSIDHHPDIPGESMRIHRSDGFVQHNRVDGRLAVSRAFGDISYKTNASLPYEQQKVIALPHICSSMTEDGTPRRHTQKVGPTRLEPLPDFAPGDFMLFGCDGIFENLSNEEVIAMVGNDLSCEGGEFDLSQTVTRLLDRAVDAGSQDNCSAGIVLYPPTQYLASPAESVVPSFPLGDMLPGQAVDAKWTSTPPTEDQDIRPDLDTLEFSNAQNTFLKYCKTFTPGPLLPYVTLPEQSLSAEQEAREKAKFLSGYFRHMLEHAASSSYAFPEYRWIPGHFNVHELKAEQANFHRVLMQCILNEMDREDSASGGGGAGDFVRGREPPVKIPSSLLKHMAAMDKAHVTHMTEKQLAEWVRFKDKVMRRSRQLAALTTRPLLHWDLLRDVAANFFACQSVVLQDIQYKRMSEAYQERLAATDISQFLEGLEREGKSRNSIEFAAKRELAKLIGPAPKRPDRPQTPEFALADRPENWLHCGLEILFDPVLNEVVKPYRAMHSALSSVFVPDSTDGDNGTSVTYASSARKVLDMLRFHMRVEGDNDHGLVASMWTLPPALVDSRTGPDMRTLHSVPHEHTVSGPARLLWPAHQMLRECLDVYAGGIVTNDAEDQDSGMLSGVGGGEEKQEESQLVGRLVSARDRMVRALRSCFTAYTRNGKPLYVPQKVPVGMSVHMTADPDTPEHYTVTVQDNGAGWVLLCSPERNMFRVVHSKGVSVLSEPGDTLPPPPPESLSTGGSLDEVRCVAEGTYQLTALEGDFVVIGSQLPRVPPQHKNSDVLELTAHLREASDRKFVMKTMAPHVASFLTRHLTQQMTIDATTRQCPRAVLHELSRWLDEHYVDMREEYARTVDDGDARDSEPENYGSLAFPVSDFATRSQKSGLLAGQHLMLLRVGEGLVAERVEASETKHSHARTVWKHRFRDAETFSLGSSAPQSELAYMEEAPALQQPVTHALSRWVSEHELATREEPLPDPTQQHDHDDCEGHGSSFESEYSDDDASEWEDTDEHDQSEVTMVEGSVVDGPSELYLEESESESEYAEGSSSEEVEQEEQAGVCINAVDSIHGWPGLAFLGDYAGWAGVLGVYDTDIFHNSLQPSDQQEHQSQGSISHQVTEHLHTAVTGARKEDDDGVLSWIFGSKDGENKENSVANEAGSGDAGDVSEAGSQEVQLSPAEIWQPHPLSVEVQLSEVCQSISDLRLLFGPSSPPPPYTLRAGLARDRMATDAALTNVLADTHMKSFNTLHMYAGCTEEAIEKLYASYVDSERENARMWRSDQERRANRGENAARSALQEKLRAQATSVFRKHRK